MRCFPLFQFLACRLEPFKSSKVRSRVQLACGLIAASLVVSMCSTRVQAQDESPPELADAVATASSPATPAKERQDALQPQTEAQSSQAVQLADSPAKSSKSTKSNVGRLPRYYAGLVDSQQRQAIYGIRLRLSQQIDALEQQLAELRAAEMQEIEAVLTDLQRSQLAELRAQSPRSVAAADGRAAASGD